MNTNAKLAGLLMVSLGFLGVACAEDEIPPFCKQAFRHLDTNADGLISPDEAKAAGERNIPLERFKAADTNNDHRLSLAECFAAKIWVPPAVSTVVVPPVTVVAPPPGKVIANPPGPGPNGRIARDIREDARDRAEDRRDRAEDIRDRREDIIDAQHNGGLADRLEDVRDRAEDRRDRAEDIRDRREDVRDATHGVPPRTAPHGHR